MNLSANQTKAIQIECDPSSHQTVAEIAEQLGVTERTLYNWRNKKEYKEEKEAQLKNFRIGIIQEAYKSILANVIKGKEKSVIWILENWENDTTDGKTTDSSDGASAIVEALRSLTDRSAED